MKKIMVLVVSLVCLLTACKQSSQPSHTQSSTINNSESFSQYSFSKGDGEVKNAVSKNSFTQPIKCTYNGKEITITPPQFTGIPVQSVYSYKSNYHFIDGYVIFDVSTDNGLMYFKVDKNGKIVSVNNDYTEITEGRESDKYMKEFATSQEIQGGRIVGNDIMIKQLGEPGSYVQYLYSVDGECLSDGYDSISYFFNGLALTVKDKKVGLIDEKGNEILTPSISFDTVIYPPNNNEYYLVFMFEDAFVIPFGGEFAVINIQR